MTGRSISEPQPNRTAQLARVIEEVTARRLAGEDLSDKQVIAEHPDLMPELGEKLEELAGILEARRRADETMDAASDYGDTIPQGDLTRVSATQPLFDSLPGYTIIREIHRGGQGVVYQAIHKSTNRKVAIKVMKEGPFAGPSDKARFEREAQILGQLKHPNIVTIHDSGSAAGVHYFVMDYISGQPLDVYMAGATERHEGTKARRREARERGREGSRDRGDRPGLSIESTLRLFQKICEAVNAAHLRGVIHRDLKPGNIRIDAEGQPHLLDFGLAKVACSPAALGGSPEDQPGAAGLHVMTMTGQFIGSLPWASPEQAEAAPSKIDVRTDVYSLGVILYQMLTGKFPYEVVGNMRDVLDQIMKAEPARPSTARVAAGPRAGRINDEVDTIVLKCLSKERERRYQTAGELARDIERYVNGEPIEAKRDSAWYILRKMLRRHKVSSGAVAGYVLLITLSALALWNSYHSANKAWQAEARLADMLKQTLETGVPAPPDISVQGSDFTPMQADGSASSIDDRRADNGVTYHVYLPARYRAESGMPALVILHGSNMNSKTYLETIINLWPKLAEDYLLIGVNGESRNRNSPDDEPRYGYTYVNFMGKSKYEGYPDTDRESPALVAEVIEEIRREFQITKLFVGGHSQGGWLTYSILMNYPDLVDGAFPMSAGLLMQCDPTAYEDERLRAAQREIPIAIVHGQKDPSFESGKYAYERFADEGFPVLHFFAEPAANHWFVRLPVDDAVRWLETMTTNHPHTLLAFAERALLDGEYRDAIAAVARARRLDESGKRRAQIDKLMKRISEVAGARAREFRRAMNEITDDSWVQDFLEFRSQFQFAEAARPAMEAYQVLRQHHQGPADKLFQAARRDSQLGNKDAARRKYREIVQKYYASTWYLLVKRRLAQEE